MSKIRFLVDRLHQAVPRAVASPRIAAPASGESAAAAAALASPPESLPWTCIPTSVGRRRTAAMPLGGVGSLAAAWGTAWTSASLGYAGGGGSASSGVLMWQARSLLLLAAREEAAGPAGVLPPVGPSGLRGLSGLASGAAPCNPRLPFRSSGLGSRWSGVAPCAVTTQGGRLAPVSAHGHLTASLVRSVSNQAESSGRAAGEQTNGRSWWAVQRGSVLLTARLAFLAGLASYATYLSYELAQVVRHVDRVPYSGRWHALLPRVMKETDALGDMRYKEDYDAAAASGKLLPPSHPDVLMVRRIGEAVVAAAVQGAEGKAAERLRGVQWEFHVVEDSHRGICYIQHGGKVWISEAWLDEHERDEGIIAAVLAHEVAHEVAQHTGENATLCRVTGNLAALWAFATVFRRAPLWVAVAGWAPFVTLAFHFSSSSVPFLRPLHWYQEYEADAIGARIMARAGFDPASDTLLHFVRSCSQDGEPGLLSALTSTHPSGMSRAVRSADGLHEACKIYTEAGFGTCEATREHLEEVVHRYQDVLKAKLERLNKQLREENGAQELRAASEARPHTGHRQRRLETDMELQQQ